MNLTMEEKMAIAVIRNYLNVDDSVWTNEYIMENYDFVIESIIKQAKEINSIKNLGVKSKTEGNQSVTFSDNIEAWSITDSIKNLLPKPFVKLFY